MICTIHQPNYLPYLGFFEKAYNSDIFIIYDNTQYKTDDYQNRNKIRTKDGWIWLTVPVSYNFGDLITEVKIPSNIKWQKKHWNAIKLNYSKAPYFKKYEKEFEEIYSKQWDSLSELNITLIKLIFKILNLKTKLIIASEITNLESKSTQALVDLCKAVQADKYIAGKDGKKYMDISLFEDNNIEIIYQDYTHPEYQQAFPGFEPYMCILDLIFNHGEDSLKILLH